MTATEKVPVLCVDDDPNVLAGLRNVLERKYRVTTVAGGNEALEILTMTDSIAVVLSDMRMPGMDGAQFLGQAYKIKPDVTRMLLTGQADLLTTIAAVNEGQIFRVLLKPCPPDALLKAVEAGVRQHQLITAERVLLAQTLVGALKVFTDVLAMSNPAAFGRANRIKQQVGALADKLGAQNKWAIETAAMLSQMGAVSLPPETAEKYYHGHPLTEDERRMTDKLPKVAESLIGTIPRLDAVREILAHFPKDYGDRLAGGQIPPGARMLKIVHDFEQLESCGHSVEGATEELRKRDSRYDPAILKVFIELQRARIPKIQVREVTLHTLKTGMVLATDVFNHNNTLLLARGTVVTEALTERLWNLPPCINRNPVQVVEKMARQN